MKNTKQSDLSGSISNLTAVLAKLNEALDDTGDGSVIAKTKLDLIKNVLDELNHILPGAGEAMGLLSTAFLQAAESSETGAVSLAGFNTALRSVLVTLGPLLIAMLSIEAAMRYWDLYQEKVKHAAEVQAEAAKKIQESTKKAIDAVRELDEAMHPERRNTATKDEHNLELQKNALNNDYNRRKALNQAEEQKELAGAGSSEEAAAIQRHFESLDKQLDDWRERQNAIIEGAMVQTMEKQLDDLEKRKDKLIEKSKPEYQFSKEFGDSKRYDETRRQIEALAAEAKAIREKLDPLKEKAALDAGNAAFNSETSRQVAGVLGKQPPAPDQGISALNISQSALQVDEATATAVRSGSSVGPAAAQQLMRDASTIAGHQVDLQTAAQIIENGANNMGIFMNQIQILSRVMSQFNPAQLARLQQDITNLQQQMTNGAMNFTR